MKQNFTRSIQPNSAQWHIRRFLYKVHRRLNVYFNQDDTLLLNQMERLANPRWKFGDYSYGHRSRSPHVVAFNEDVRLEIGKFCCFAENVNIIVGYGYHRVDWVTTYPFSVLFDNVAQPAGVPYAKGDVIIGNDVWVCTGSTIMSGVTIGNGAVVAAGSVVTKDVPAYTVVAGNPARIINQRFSDDIVTRLNTIRWWDWSIDKIRAECPILLSGDVETFVARHSDEFNPETEHNHVGIVE